MGKYNLLIKNDLEELLAQLKKDDRSVVDELFLFYYPRLYRFSKSILKMEDQIDDLLQEVFVKIWLNRHKIDRPETFNAFIFTITKNEVLNLIRSKLKEKSFRDALYLKSVAVEYLPVQQLEFEEVKSGIDRIVATLPERRQQIFLLSRMEGCSNKEIAKMLHISEKTVEDHISHAIRKIKSSMKEMGMVSLLYCALFL